MQAGLWLQWGPWCMMQGLSEFSPVRQGTALPPPEGHG